jgi:hypothetical protein
MGIAGLVLSNDLSEKHNLFKKAISKELKLTQKMNQDISSMAERQ